MEGPDLSWMDADSWVPVVGYRRFLLPYANYARRDDPAGWDYHLRSTGGTMNTPRDRKKGWVPGVSTVRCLRVGSKRHVDSVPAHDCSCGLHAFMDLEGALGYPMAPSLVAGVIGWGTVFFDERWWRAEHAMPVALIEPDPCVIRAPKTERGERIAERWLFVARAFAEGASRLYGVPILGLKQVEEYTLRFGEEYRD